jgi:hypothetical protein
MTDQTIPMGFKTDTTVQRILSTDEIFQTLLDYLKSLNANVVFTDTSVIIRDTNFNFAMYIYNAMLILHGTITEKSSLTTDMFIKQDKDKTGDYLITYEPERIKVHMRFKISGNEYYDRMLPIMAFAKLAQLVNSPAVLNLLPPSLQ